MMPNISMSLSDINGPLSMCVYDLHFLYIVCMDCAKFCLLDILSSETAQIWGFPVFSWECVGVMTWNLACWCIMTTYRKKILWSRSVDFPPLGVTFTLWDWSSLRHHSWECMVVMALNLACWCIPTTLITFRFGLSFNDFSRFGTNLTYWNWSNLRFPGIFVRNNGRNGLEFRILLNPDYLQNWLDQVVI